MAISAARLHVDVDAETATAERKLGRFHNLINRGASFIGKATLAASAFGITTGAAFGIKAVTAASDLNETLSKTNVVFGAATQGVIDQADRMAEQFGLNKTTMLDAASAIGLVGKASGLAQREAAGMSNKLAALAADASSFYNVPLEEALGAIRSGLVGEAEPLRRFGVLLNDAAVKAEAVRLGIAKTGEELTEAQKVQARSSLIMRGMTDASGDLARTQGSLSNRLREIRGRIENAAASLGLKLLPYATKLAEWGLRTAPRVGRVLGSVFGRITSYVDQAREAFRVVFQGWAPDGLTSDGNRIAAMLQTVRDRTQPLREQIGRLVESLGGMGNTLKIVGGIVLAFVAPWLAVGAAFAYAYSRSETFRNVVNAVVGWLVQTALPAIIAFTTGVVNGVKAAVAFVQRNWPTVRRVIQQVMDFIGPYVRIAFDQVRNVITTAVRIVTGVIKFWAAVFRGDWSGAWDAAKGIVKAAWDFIKRSVDNGIDLVIQLVKDLPGLILSGLGNLGNLLYEVGKDMIRGLIRGIKDMAGEVADAAVGVVKGGVDKVKSFLKIGSPSRLMERLGRWTGEGFWRGIRRERGRVRREWGRVITLPRPDVDGPGFGGPPGFGPTPGGGVGGPWRRRRPPRVMERIEYPRLGRFSESGGGGRVVQVINVAGSVWRERDLAEVIRGHEVRVGIRNGNVFGRVSA